MNERLLKTSGTDVLSSRKKKTPKNFWGLGFPPPPPPRVRSMVNSGQKLQVKGNSLKELCHEDITVLGQFCAKHIVAEAEIYSHFINIQEIQV